MPAFTAFKSNLLRTATNLQGWRTQRKLIVIESDDWGAIRMPSQQAYQALLNAGIRVDRSHYNCLDCLEKRDDLQALMNVLDSHKDVNGRPPVFTFNTVMGNPDFEAIESDNFERFHHRDLFDSYRYYHGENLQPLWKKAIEEGFIQPQFHAREHLNVPMWMRDICAGHKQTLIAFEQGFYGLTTRTSSQRQNNYLAAYWSESMADLELTRHCLDQGLYLFKNTFGFDSKTFIPCNYVYPFELENTLLEHGVKLMQGQRGQLAPDPLHSDKRVIYRSFTGKKRRSGLLDTVRNVHFEPFESNIVEWDDLALNQIRQSFMLKKPAIISTHRVNYVSGMNVQHRDRSLRLLDSLLKKIFTRWPDAEVLTSDQLFNEMKLD